MALAELLFGKTNAEIDSIVVDASISEKHTRRAKATRHPVEEGSDVSDHVKVEPAELTIEGQVSNHPATLGGGTFAGGPNRAEDAYTELCAIVDGKRLVTIITTLDRYDDMVLENLQVPRDASLGNTVRFTCSATQIRMVSAKTIGANPKAGTSTPTTKVGKAGTTPATGAAGSVAAKLLGL